MEILSSTTTTSIVQNVPATDETVSEESSMKTDDKETEMEDLEPTYYDTGLHETGFNDTEILLNEKGKDDFERYFVFKSNLLHENGFSIERSWFRISTCVQNVNYLCEVMT